jgi:pyruvate dehydrogenase E2 component (dihydrolipoamide acetyltransferase)
MPSNILMPALSPTMEKGNLTRWLKKEGDTVKSGDVLAEIETDKATMEVEAVDEGVLAKIVVPEGTQDVPVNELIGVIAAEGESVSATPKAAAAAPAAAPPASAAPAPAAAAPAPAAPSPKANGAAPRIFASPLAKRLAKEAGIDLGAVAGSGPHGRIVERDITAAKAGGPRLQPAAPAPQAAAPPPVAAAPAPAAPAAAPKAALAPSMPDEMVKKFFAPGSYDEIPHDSMRKVIARRLVEAKQTIPHFYLSADCEIDALMALREQVNKAAPLNKEGSPAYRVSVNDFVIKALAMALVRVPDANVTWTEGAMLKHKQADVGVAVSIPGGLITPVVRNAAGKTISVISSEMKDYAARAKQRKLKPEEYQGGSTAVSNLGMFGVKNFQAVINPPHATILAVGAGEQRVVVKDGAPAVANLMTVTLSTDHRAVDGALGAQLLQAFKTLVEHPMAMLV